MVFVRLRRRRLYPGMIWIFGLVYELAENMGVLQAIALAGGLDEWADGNDIRIIRKTKGNEEHILFNYKKAVSKKADPLASILKSDDTIFVP